MQMALTAAYESNRTLVVREDQGWSFAERSYCGERAFSCYFEPLSGCDVHNDAELNALLHDYDKWPLTVTSANFSAPGARARARAFKVGESSLTGRDRVEQ